ncbi:S28 family serine protease [Allonocardiopsis opalescens]|uniref:PS-10 peptidase S37 n=1 Tax=Allonocardiopsis opalescens TaxID=1144618 RepID=A0A2T0Q0H0_9ACTN|nr:S28 family serine protease [Allonocardiopsis opalescens]PRX97205.1 PS-10 peptidase S37 [Allonocardiopsis opalescens]
MLPAAVALGLLAGAAPAAAEPEPDPVDELAAAFEALPGLTVVSAEPAPGGAHIFLTLSFTQRVDHTDPSAGTFEQRLTVLHRGFDRPTVLHTTGYGLVERPFRDEPTVMLDGNQVHTEQRFFSPSRPDPADWSDLDIWQAATDHHRIVAAIDDLYEGAWISTGASKGGMTSVYHRRFYPGDVDGTVAYVAPNDVHDRHDAAYLDFFETVGTDPACQESLAALQHEALERRGELLERYEAAAAAEGWTFTQTLGSADRALEMLILDTPWAFWQYQEESACAAVPAADASTDEIYAFLDEISGFAFYTDQGTIPYIPYYYQAGTQLGSPSVPTGHVEELLRYPGLFGPRSYVPREIPMRFDHRAMPDIDRWVRTQGSELLFVNGEFDPWAAEPFRLGHRTRDSLSLEVPRGNHGADIAQLPAADRERAGEALLRWAGLDGVAALSTPAPAIPELDEVEIDRGPTR